MSTRLAVSVLAFLALLGACDAGITESDIDQFSSIAVGTGFGCGLTGDGNALCWGEGRQGQLGDGKGASRTDPARIATGAHFSQLAVGSDHACGLATNGRVLCWGSNSQQQLGNSEGELDCLLLQANGWMQDFADQCSTVPVQLDADLHFKSISAGRSHTCGLTSGGEIWCWGSSQYGLGDSLSTVSALPVLVKATTDFSAIAIGEQHSCAVGAQGLGWCWGFGGLGATGLGMAESPTATRLVPSRINSTADLRAVAVGNSHSCALTAAGDVICWGAGSQGQRGDSSTVQIQHDPTFVKTDRNFSAVVAGLDRTCALESGTRAAWCWGDNVNGSLGTGVFGLDRVAPSLVIGGMTFSRLSLARFVGSTSVMPICGTTGDGVYCWGQVPQPLTFEE